MSSDHTCDHQEALSLIGCRALSSQESHFLSRTGSPARELPVPVTLNVCMSDFDLQVRDGAMNCLVEIYRHVGERVRMDLGKKGLPQSRCVQTLAGKLCVSVCVCV